MRFFPNRNNSQNIVPANSSNNKVIKLLSFFYATRKRKSPGEFKGKGVKKSKTWNSLLLDNTSRHPHDKVLFFFLSDFMIQKDGSKKRKIAHTATITILDLVS